MFEMMNNEHSILDSFKRMQEAYPDDNYVPLGFVEGVLKTNARLDTEHGRREERKELVCRLLASGAPADEVSLIFKIRVEEIRDIEKYNGDKIADYARKLKSRRKGREREAIRRQEMEALINRRKA